jgi:ankyrin repeat protein
LGSHQLRFSNLTRIKLTVRRLITEKSFVGLQDGATAAFLAAQEGHEKVLSQLLTSKADVDAIRRDGVAPLGIASQNGHNSAVKLLLDFNADPDATAKVFSMIIAILFCKSVKQR